MKWQDWSTGRALRAGLSKVWVVAVAGTIVLIALLGIRPRGDWAEYVLMARALVSHGSPAVRESDFRWLHETVPLPAQGLTLAGNGFARALDGQHYAIHFWLYSLIAAPLVGIASVLRASPFYAFAVLNGLCLFAATAYASRGQQDGIRRLLCLAAILVCGGTFYLSWIGPEIMTASAVLVACLAAMRGDMTTGPIAAGLAASQNPSAIVLLPYLWLWWWLNRRDGASVAPTRPMVLVAGTIVGLVLAGLPYAFFRLRFGVFSLVAEQAADPARIGWSRLASLLFDLNQGMIIGLPGLILGFLVAAFLSKRAVTSGDARRRILTIIVSLGCFVGLVLPVLSQTNWNADTVVIMRYAYWTPMPLLAAVLVLDRGLAARGRAAMWVALLAPQFGTLSIHGLWGERLHYLDHSPIARMIFRHSPALYNPAAEIFWERTAKVEDEITTDSIVHWPAPGLATKVMAHWSRPVDCSWYGRSDLLMSGQVTTADDGFHYLNAPFACRPAEAAATRIWRLDARHEGLTLSTGWSAPEASGTWTLGTISSLRVTVPTGFRVTRFRWHGVYYGRSTVSFVRVQGRDLGRFDLSDGTVTVPDDLSGAPTIEFTLSHPDATSPEEWGQSKDNRKLAYFLMALGAE
jgi:hypothetical protein